MLTKKAKFIIISIAAVLFSLLVAGTVVLSKRNAELKNRIEVAETNNHAYQMRIEGQSQKIIQFELSTEYLRHCNDSISIKLVETMDRLKISEKKLKEANYLLSQYSKTDTVVIHDTIFCEPDFWLDTIIGDRWVSTRLEMFYPSTIIVTPSVVSEKKVFIYTNRETVNEPSKCFLVRMFQKKHTVTRVEIEESNPYIISEQNVFIKTGD
jgi:hypothetical protein